MAEQQLLPLQPDFRLLQHKVAVITAIAPLRRMRSLPLDVQREFSRELDDRKYGKSTEPVRGWDYNADLRRWLSPQRDQLVSDFLDRKGVPSP